MNKKTLLKELVTRQNEIAHIQQFRLEDHLFEEQLKFVKDHSPTKIAVCSRRAGKSTACAADLVYTAVNNPDTVSVYITLDRKNAKKILWKEIVKLNRKYQLKAKANLSELSFTFPNDSVIYLSGAKDVSEIEKFRGLAIKLAYIDEAQSFRAYVEDLINDVLSPALMDHAGTLCLIGTPGAIPKGFYHDCYVNPNWSSHHWTFWNNPFILEKSKMTHQQLFDRVLKQRSISSADPSIQREFFGRFVTDTSSLVLHYNKETNNFNELPKSNKYNYIMGIDLGFDDADAIAVLGWSESEVTTYLVEEIVVPKQGITPLIEQIQKLQKKYEISKMVIDQGGLGKKIAEELRRRHHIPVEAADKTRKMENLALLDDALRTSKVKAKDISKFAQDTYLVEIDKDKSTSDKLVISNKYHSDIIDAVLYAFRESPAYTYIKPKPIPKFGSNDWMKEQQEKLWEEALENHKQQQEINERIKNFGWQEEDPYPKFD